MTLPREPAPAPAGRKGVANPSITRTADRRETDCDGVAYSIVMPTDDELTVYLRLLVSRGWAVVETQPGDDLARRREIRERYPRIPKQYERFLARVRSCVNADETVWYLCVEDYNREPDAADPGFAWDEFERMELEDEGPRGPDPAEVRRFWDEHMPFMLSVGGEYAWIGFRVAGDRFGSVVEAWEDLRNPSDVARDFDEFIRLHSNALNGAPGKTTLGDYV
jgi:hypothetical protein